MPWCQPSEEFVSRRFHTILTPFQTTYRRERERKRGGAHADNDESVMSKTTS